MTFVTWLVLLTAQTPALTFMVVDDSFKSQQSCETMREEFIKDNHIDEQKARRLMCLSIVTSKLKDV